MTSPDAKLEILMVTPMYPRPGKEGYGAFVMHQVDQLRAFGHKVDVLDFPGYRSKLEYLKAAIEVFRRTRRNQYALVHAHYGLTGLVTLFRNSVPLVITLHGSDALVGHFAPFVSRLVSRLADATIVVSPAIAQRVEGDVIPCGVDTSIFASKPKNVARQRLGLAADRKYVLFPFDPERAVKRFDFAQAAVQQLAAEGINVELLTVSRAQPSEMPWYYSAADAMVLCSYSEGSPTSVKEALACDLPIVSTDVGDVRQVTKGIAGVQIVENRVDSLAAGIKRALHPPKGFVFEGHSAMERYSQKKTVQAVLQIYRRVIQGRSITRQPVRTPMSQQARSRNR